jgi:hypothetical protein
MLVPGAAQRHQRVYARYGGALQTRDRHKRCNRYGPGSAAHHFVLRRV